MIRRQLDVIVLKPDTRATIAQYLMKVACNGYDVQAFDPALKYQGTKQSLSEQMGYYPTCNFLALKKLGYAIAEILKEYGEEEAIACFRRYQTLFSATQPDVNSQSNTSSDIAYIQKIQFLPEDLFEDINPADLIAPNGLRIPAHLNTWPTIRDYSAKLLVPKLLLASICSLHNQQPWMDTDMDLNSTMHAMRTDPDKLHVNAGYGGGYIKQHTDGYWNPQSNVPLLVVFLGISNPNQEPTSFIPVEAIFRIPTSHHPTYKHWHATIADLIPPDQTPHQFLEWIVAEALKPQFSFVMGVLGGDAKRGVYETPLLEKDTVSGRYIFRAKSTFKGTNDSANTVVEFINRIIVFLSEAKLPGAYQDISLSPGEIYIALNGAGLSLNLCPSYEADGYAYWVRGSATIHGRNQLIATNGKIDRTLARGNSLRSPERTFYAPWAGASDLLSDMKAACSLNGPRSTAHISLDRDTFFPAKGSVNHLLSQGIRGNALKR